MSLVDKKGKKKKKKIKRKERDELMGNVTIVKKEMN